MIRYLAILLFFSFPMVAQNYALHLDSLSYYSLATRVTETRSGSWTIEFWYAYLQPNNTSNYYLFSDLPDAGSSAFPAIQLNRNGTEGLTGILADEESNWNTNDFVGEFQQTTSTDSGSWVHIAIAYREEVGDTSFVIYENGDSLLSDLDGQGGTGIFSFDRLGYLYNPVSGFAKIYLDELRVWHSRRSPAEIAANYNKELTGTEDSLKYYWKFNQTLTSSALANTLTKVSGTEQYVLGPVFPAAAEAADNDRHNLIKLNSLKGLKP